MSQKSNSDFTILTINSEAKWRAQRIGADSPLADPLFIHKDGVTLRSFFEYAFARVIGKPEGLIEPTDLAVDRCGILFILDGKQSRIAMYDPQQDRLEWIECIGGVGDLPTQFQDPQAIAVTDRTLYVADTGNRRVRTGEHFLTTGCHRARHAATGDVLNGEIKSIAKTYQRKHRRCGV